MEQWRDVVGYEGKYQVSNYGRVKSLERYQKNHSKLQKVEEKILSQSSNGNGYIFVSLWKNGNCKKFYIHRLVAETFIGDIPNGYTVNHLDFNTSNNCVDNLEIVTYSENNNYSSKAGRYANRGGHKVKITYNNGSIDIYDSIVDAANNTGICRDTIMKILSGKSSGKVTKEKHNIKTIETA